MTDLPQAIVLSAIKPTAPFCNCKFDAKLVQDFWQKIGFIRQEKAERRAMTAQRVCDVFLALVLLAVCLPVLAIACILTMCEFGTGPFVRQERILRDGRVVRVFRLRTVSSRKVRARRSSAGRLLHRLHVEQVPQLFNVVLGDLTFAENGPDDVDGRGFLVWREH